MIIYIILGVCVAGVIYSSLGMGYSIPKYYKESMVLNHFAYLLAIYDLYKNGLDKHWYDIQKDFELNLQVQDKNTLLPWRWGKKDFWADTPQELKIKYEDRFGAITLIVIEGLARDGFELPKDGGKDLVAFVDEYTKTNN